ncbi:unnamed protein product [Sympodiomycopsis kandeliae]
MTPSTDRHQTRSGPSSHRYQDGPIRISHTHSLEHFVPAPQEFTQGNIALATSHIGKLSEMRRMQSIPDSSWSHSQSLSPNTSPEASYGRQEMASSLSVPSSPSQRANTSVVRFENNPITRSSASPPRKDPVRKYSEPLKSALTVPSGGRPKSQSQARPPQTIHSAANRAQELRRKALKLLDLYGRIAENVYSGKFLDHPDNQWLVSEALTCWGDFESFKVERLFDQNPYHQHFIQVEDYLSGIASTSKTSVSFDEIAKSVLVANCAIFVHYTWNLPDEARRQVSQNGTAWPVRSLSEMKEAWEVFWPLIVPSNPTSTELSTTYFLDCYLELCTQAFSAYRLALHYKITQGQLSSEMADAESAVDLEEIMKADPVEIALRHGKLAFETQQTQTKASQLSAPQAADLWQSMSSERVRVLEDAGYDVDFIRSTFTPLETAVALTDLVKAILSAKLSASPEATSQSLDSDVNMPPILTENQVERIYAPATISSQGSQSGVELLSIASSGGQTFQQGSRKPRPRPPSSVSSADNVDSPSPIKSLRLPGNTAYGPFASTPLESQKRAPVATSSSSVSDYSDFDSLDKDEYASQRAQWLAELFAQEDEMSDEEQSDGSSALLSPQDDFGNQSDSDDSQSTVTTSLNPLDDLMGLGSRSSRSLLSDAIDQGPQAYSSDNEAHTPTMAQSYSPSHRAKESPEQISFDSSSLSPVSDGSTQRTLRELLAQHLRYQGSEVSLTPESQGSDFDTLSIDSQTQGALNVPSTPDAFFSGSMQRQPSNARRRAQLPAPALSDSQLAVDSRSNRARFRSPQRHREVLRVRQGRIVREAVTGETPNLFKATGQGERLFRFGSQESSDSDVFLQRREKPQKDRQRNGQTRFTETGKRLTAPGQEQKPQASEDSHSDDSEASQIESNEIAPTANARYRLPPSRQPRNPLICVEIPAAPAQRRRARSKALHRGDSGINEVQNSLSRMKVASNPAAGQASRPASIVEFHFDVSYNDDIPEHFVAGVANALNDSDAVQGRSGREISQSRQIARSSIQLNEAERARIDELMQLDGHGAGEFEGDNDPELTAIRKQLTLEYWFARERPGIEHLPHPRPSGPSPASGERNPHRDVVLGVSPPMTTERQSPADQSRGEETRFVLSQDTASAADTGEEVNVSTAPSGSQVPETQTVDAAAASSDPEDEDFVPTRQKTKRRRVDVGIENGDSVAGTNLQDEGSPATASRNRSTSQAPKRSRKRGSGSGNRGVGHRLAAIRTPSERASDRSKNLWTTEETECFLTTMYQLARLKRENPHYKIYSEILSRHGKFGSESRILARRDNIALKDKARSELWRMRREGQVIPYWKNLYWTKVFDREKTGAAPAPTRIHQKTGQPQKPKGPPKLTYPSNYTIESQPHDVNHGSDGNEEGNPTMEANSSDPIANLEAALDSATLARQDGTSAAQADQDGASADHVERLRRGPSEEKSLERADDILVHSPLVSDDEENAAEGLGEANDIETQTSRSTLSPPRRRSSRLTRNNFGSIGAH